MNTTRLFLIVFSILLICSCTIDSYDKGDGENSMLQAEMADIHFGKDKKADYMVTDNDERFTIKEPFTNKVITTPDSTYRFVTYFSLDGQVADVTGVNTVGVTVPKRIKDMKNDPVKFESAWLSNTRKYLNASFYIMLGASDNEKAIQTLGCNIDTLMTNADKTQTLHLTLYHDQGGVPEYYSQRTYISIPLQDIDADTVSLTINSYSGMIEKTFCIKKR